MERSLVSVFIWCSFFNKDDAQYGKDIIAFECKGCQYNFLHR